MLYKFRELISFHLSQAGREDDADTQRFRFLAQRNQQNWRWSLYTLHRNRGQMPRIYKELQKLQDSKTNNPGWRQWTAHFSKEQIQWLIDMKKCSGVLPIREIQITTIVKFYLTQWDWPTFANLVTMSAGIDVERKVPDFTVVGRQKV